MNTTDLVHYLSTAGDRSTTSSQPTAAPSYHQLLTPLRGAVARARQYILSQQRPDGSWHGRQCSDASLAGRLVLLLTLLEREQSEVAEQAAATILDAQLPSGGWSRTSDGPVDLSTSVEAYFALKLAGHDPSDVRLSRARDVIRSLGGPNAADVTTRWWLALLGQVDYDLCPAVWPEQLLVPKRRGAERCRLTAPLSIVWSHRPLHNVGVERGVRELFVRHPSEWSVPGGRRRHWSTVAGRLASKWLPLPLRDRALDLAEQAVLARVTRRDDCQPGFDELVWLTVALHSLGYDADSREMQACEARLRDMVLVDDDADLVQPQLMSSTCWDTAVAVETLCTSGVQLDHIASGDAVGWLPRAERRCGLSNTTMELASLLRALMCVESQTPDDVLPPDIQVTGAWANSAAKTLGCGQSRRRLARHVAGRLIEQAVARQNPDGGWSPGFGGGRRGSTSAVTGAMLVALALHGKTHGNEAVDRAIACLRAAQRADGSWDSATGVRLVHGTSLAVRGLTAAGLNADDTAVAAGLNWLAVHQQPSGGWGEMAVADQTQSDYLAARPTASQTAWALLALATAGRAVSDAACRAVHFLLETQEDDGRWDEPHFTLRDAASGRWYRNELHSVTGPLAALSRWAVAAAQEPEETGRVQLRLVGAET